MSAVIVFVKVLIKQELGLQHQEKVCLACSLATNGNTRNSTLIADRNLAHTLSETLDKITDPNLSLCKKNHKLPPALYFTAPDFTAGLAPYHQRNHPGDTPMLIRRLPFFQKQELNLGISLTYAASTLFYPLK